MDINNIPTGEQINWKFGLITREVYRVSKNKFEIHDFSSGWTTAIVNKKTFEGLTKGEINILDIDFS